MSMFRSLLRFVPQNNINIFGKNSLIDSILPYYFLPVYLIIVFALQMQFQNPFIIIFVTYAFIPILDEIFSLDERNPTKDKSLQFKLPIYLTIVIDWGLFYYALNLFSKFQITFYNFHQLLGYIFIFFNLNAAQFAVAHQIMHKQNINKVIGTLHMLKTLNMHFTYQHLYGHHRKVATPQDPASAQKNDNVYLFFLKSNIGSYKKWKNFLEQSFSFKCYKLYCFYSLDFLIVRISNYCVFFVMCFGSYFLFRSYKLYRALWIKKKNSSKWRLLKSYSQTQLEFTTQILQLSIFQIAKAFRPSLNSKKPYQILQSIKESAQLPHGYIIITAISLFLQIWFKIMNPLVEQYNKQKFQVQNAQIQMKKAKQQTRLFVIQLSFTFFVIFLCTTLLKK